MTREEWIESCLAQAGPLTRDQQDALRRVLLPERIKKPA